MHTHRVCRRRRAGKLQREKAIKLLNTIINAEFCHPQKFWFWSELQWPFQVSVFLVLCSSLLVSTDLETLHLGVLHCTLFYCLFILVDFEFFFIMFWWNFSKKFHTSVFCCHLSTELFKVNNHQNSIVISELTRNSDSESVKILL